MRCLPPGRRATPPTKRGGGWTVRYVWSDDNWSEAGKEGEVAEEQENTYLIPAESPKGFKATLRLKVESWA